MPPGGTTLGKITGSAGDTGVIGTLERERGEYEPHLMAFLARFVRPGDVCLDVGANIGVMSLCLARLCPDGRVYAFEPGRASYAYLERNVAENALGNVVPVPLGAYDTNGSLGFAVDATHPGGAFVATGEAASERIDVVRIDDWIATNLIDRVDVVKLDVEGAEVRVLAGAHRTLARHRPLVIVECNPIALRQDADASTDALIAMLTAVYGTVYFLHEATPCPLESPVQLRRQLEADGIVELVAGDRVIGRSPRPRVVYRTVRAAKDRLRRYRAPAMNYVHEPSYNARIDVDEVRAPHATTTTVQLHVQNTCARAWFSSAFARNPVLASYHWLDAHGEVVAYDGLRTPFPRPLAPGRATTLALTVQMPDAPGEYVLACALVQEGFAWFDDLRPDLVVCVKAVAT